MIPARNLLAFSYSSFVSVASYRHWKVVFVLGFCTLLQGCLLNFFFAPKISPEDLPGSIELQSLKEAYANHCGRCHVLVAPRFFDPIHPIEIYTRRYRDANIISVTEQAEVEAYLRTLIAETGRL